LALLSFELPNLVSFGPIAMAMVGSKAALKVAPYLRLEAMAFVSAS